MTRSPGRGQWLALTATVLLGGAVAGCGSDGTMLEPVDGLQPQAAINDPGDPFAADDNSLAFVCVVSPVAGTYTYDISGAPAGGSGNPGPTVTNDPAAIAPGTCEEVATAGPGAGFFDADLITASQQSIPGGVQLDNVLVEDAKYSHQGTTTIFLGSDVSNQGDPATGLVGNERATRITFQYSALPAGGGEGCTPGYWKQKHHFGDWVGYAPDQPFGSVFEDAFPGMTLLDVLKQGGGGLKALGRHTVAALLNSANGNVSYGMTTTQVIDAFDAVFPGGDYEGQKDLFEDLNEAGCPL